MAVLTAPRLPQRIALSLENNAGLRFPAGKPPYYAEWVPPRGLTADEAREWAEKLREALKPADPGLIIAHLAKLSIHFKTANDTRTEAEWKSLFRDYADDLGVYPADIIVDGIKAYRQSGKWWPKIAELHAHMYTPLYRRKVQYQRLCELAGIMPEPSWVPPAMRTAKNAIGLNHISAETGVLRP